jgi:hypothetical protein
VSDAPQVKDIFTDQDGDTQVVSKIVGKADGGSWDVEYERSGWPIPARIRRQQGRFVEVATSN